MPAPESRPVAVENLEPATLWIEWADGHESLYPHRLLRERCECAACVDEWSRRPILDPATLPIDLRLDRWDPTGRYGLNLFFSDGHSTGIYSFRLLRAMCPCPECSGASPPEGTESR